MDNLTAIELAFIIAALFFNVHDMFFGVIYYESISSVITFNVLAIIGLLDLGWNR